MLRRAIAAEDQVETESVDDDAAAQRTVDQFPLGDDADDHVIQCDCVGWRS